MSYTQLSGLIPPVPTLIINRSDLQYQYAWTAAAEHDNARLTGFPDNRLLSRKEGYEMLHFLNRFCRDTHYTQSGAKFGKADGLKAERMIHTVVPSNLHSQAHVRSWLVENWANFQ